MRIMLQSEHEMIMIFTETSMKIILQREHDKYVSEQIHELLSQHYNNDVITIIMSQNLNLVER